MATSGKPTDPFNPEFMDNVKDSAQQIWLAGLGAFAKAQAEGGKVFDKLVKEGAVLQEKTQAQAQERFAEATSRMQRMASDFTGGAGAPWGKLEGLFEARVAKALAHLGLPSAAEVAELRARVEALEARQSAPEPAARPAAKKAPRKTAAKAPKKTPRTAPKKAAPRD